MAARSADQLTSSAHPHAARTKRSGTNGVTYRFAYWRYSHASPPTNTEYAAPTPKSAARSTARPTAARNEASPMAASTITTASSARTSSPSPALPRASRVSRPTPPSFRGVGVRHDLAVIGDFERGVRGDRKRDGAAGDDRRAAAPVSPAGGEPHEHDAGEQHEVGARSARRQREPRRDQLDRRVVGAS